MRVILQWLLVLVIAAALATWVAWLVRDDLVAAGLLPEPPPDEVGFPAQPLPPLEPEVPDSDGSDSAVPDWDVTGTSAVLLGAVTETGQPPLEAGQTGAYAETLDCVVAGPFNDRDGAVDAVERLRAAGAKADIEEQTVDAEPYYLVYVEPAVSRDEARRTLLALQSQGVDDVAVIRTGERVNGVSVGRFTSHEFANARLERISTLGYEMNLLAIDRDQTVYRLRVHNAAADLLAHLPYVVCDEG